MSYPPDGPLGTSKRENVSTRHCQVNEVSLVERVTLSPKQEALAHRVASCSSAAAAYRQLYPISGAANAETRKPRLLQGAQVSISVKELHDAQRQFVTEKFATSREDVLRHLYRIMVTSISETHPLCEGATSPFSPSGKQSIRSKMPAKPQRSCSR
jgi:hypothetical protein